MQSPSDESVVVITFERGDPESDEVLAFLDTFTIRNEILPPPDMAGGDVAQVQPVGALQ